MPPVPTQHDQVMTSRRDTPSSATLDAARAPTDAAAEDGVVEASRSSTPSTCGGMETVILNPDHPPRFDTFHFSLRGPVLYAFFLILLNVAVPCVSAVFTRGTTPVRS